MTQEFVASRLGVTPQAIARWESGKNPVPTKHLRDLATLLGISVTDLVATDSPEE
jgi:transcriptional regulator with XRE-family HTH domain